VARSVGHRGRANLGNQEEPAAGIDRSDAARLVARHRSRKGEGVAREKRKEVLASVPTRIGELGFASARRKRSLQKSVGGIWPRISSVARSKKGGQHRVNGGLVGASVGGETSELASCEGMTASRVRIDVAVRRGEGPGWRESVIRRSQHRLKAVVRSRDRGVEAGARPTRSL
jgi:hypothetical protein